MASSTPAHYIRTIHTSFTAAHPNPWARSSAHASPLLSSSHANLPLYTAQPLGSAANGHVHHPGSKKFTAPIAAPASGAGGRRRAYAFRAPSVAAPMPRKSGGYKFDPFADEPTTPVPTLSTLASLSVPPSAPRLAAATLPPPVTPRRTTSPGGGMYNHQLHQAAQRRHVGYPIQARRQHPAAIFDGHTSSASGTTEIWRGFSPIPKARALAYEVEEYDYDSPAASTNNVFRASSRGGNGGLLTTPLSAPTVRSASAPPISGAASRRSPSPPSRGLNPQSPVFTPSRPLARTPSPPAPAPGPTYATTRSSMLNDKDAKSRLVAGILLNRVHVQKPMRRRPMFGDAKRPYVPSRLSSVVACEA